MSNGFSLELPTGATMYVERSGAGPPVVLIHGNFVSLRQWDPQLALADRLDLIRYDIRGFGRSPLGTGRYSDEADLAALLDALGIDSAHLVGTSYGGAVAIDVALRYPARVRSILIVPGGIGGWEAPDWMFTGWDDFERAISAGDYSGAAAAIMAFPPMRPLEARPTLHRQVATMIEDHRWAEYGAPVEVDALDPPAATRLGEIQVPTLVLSGSLDDDAFLALGDRMAEEMSSAERLIIEGGSHLVWMEFPGEFNTEVADFIERQGSP